MSDDGQDRPGGEEDRFVYKDEDYQAAYVFDPDDGPPQERPSKRRRVSKKAGLSSKNGDSERSLFVPLMDGKEGAEAIRGRERLFEECWSRVEARIQRMLRDANRATLERVGFFAGSAPMFCGGQIPSAFIVTGPNLASQQLLFEQLGESLLSSTSSRFVKLRSSDATNLKATLKKIVRDLTSRSSDENDEVQVTTGRLGHKYLNYDLAAVKEFVTTQEYCQHVFVAFQDSEGFDSTLLSELIHIFSTWWPEIPFTLLFGVATSVELLQNRLPKSACELLYGAQFDAAQGASVLEQVIIKAAVAAHDVPLRIGPSLLETLMSRQRDQVAGIQAFISSLKYTYMCHFYANPLSIFMSATPGDDFSWVQPEHLEGVRSQPSFREHVEYSLKDGNRQHALSLLEDDKYLLGWISESATAQLPWISRLLRSVQILLALEIQLGDFTSLYIEAMARGIDLESEDSGVVDTVRKMDPELVAQTMGRVLAYLTQADDPLRLVNPHQDSLVSSQLSKLYTNSEVLRTAASATGHTLRSKYSGQTKVVRTTVIAQRVQLSRDSAALTQKDLAFTAIVDAFVALLIKEVGCKPATAMFLHEAWLYDSRTPYRDVFVPRPRAVFERSLTRPTDYLACKCCDDGGGISPMSPPASIVYRLYREAGALVNVADLWATFYGIVGSAVGDGDAGLDERGALAMFYQGLAELRALGYVKGSKKKVDHVAKVKWL